MRIALYEPDIPQNTGTILRLCACLGIEAHIIEPSGFPVTDRAFRRAGMDYIDNVSIARHGSFAAFEAWRRRERLQLVLLTTAAERSYLDHKFTASQVLLFGRESAGAVGVEDGRPVQVDDGAHVRAGAPRDDPRTKKLQKKARIGADCATLRPLVPSCIVTWLQFMSGFVRHPLFWGFQCPTAIMTASNPV